jgi:hypothetical protein
MARYANLLLTLAVVIVAPLLAGQLAYQGGHFVGSH